MPERIKLTAEEMGLISLYQTVSRATARDCVIDQKLGRVIFIISKGEMGLAIGKEGATVKNVEKLIGKPVEVVEYSDDPVEFIKNSLHPEYVTDVRLTDKLDGTKMAVVVVDRRRRGLVLGPGGKNAERARLLAKRYFQISNLSIVTPQ